METIEPIKVSSIDELRGMEGNPLVTLDVIVEDIQKGNSLLIVSNGNSNGNDIKKLNCWALGGALLGIDVKPNDPVTIIGTYHPNKNPFNEFLELKGYKYQTPRLENYQTPTKDSELPQ